MGTTDGSWTGARLERLSVLSEMARLEAVVFQAGRPVHSWIWSRLNWPVWLPLYMKAIIADNWSGTCGAVFEAGEPLSWRRVIKARRGPVWFRWRCESIKRRVSVGMAVQLIVLLSVDICDCPAPEAVLPGPVRFAAT